MAGFTKTASNSITGTSTGDIILVTLGEHALTGTIDGGAFSDELRFGSTTPGDILFIGANITGIELVTIGGGTAVTATIPAAINNNPLDIDASGAVNGLTIFGNAAVNLIVGSEFGDTIAVGVGGDDLYGGGGNDVFSLNTATNFGAVSIDGEDGFDRVRVSGNAGTVVLTAATSVELVDIQGANAINVDASAIFNDAGLEMTGNSGVNILIGTDFADTMTGGAGADQLRGGGGNDVFLFSVPGELPGTEKIDGQEGSDEIRFTAITAGQSLTLNANTKVETVRVSDADGDSSGTTANLNLVATAAPNALTLVGNDGTNTFRGTKFADTMLGGGGDDYFFISSPLDHGATEVIQGGAGVDRIFFDTPVANQTLLLAPGTAVEEAKVLPASGHIDASALASGIFLTGSNGFNSLTGGSGNDTIEGGKGQDSLSGGSGNDVFVFRALADIGTVGANGALTPNDFVDGGSGMDTLLFDPAAQNLNFKISNDQVAGIERIEFAAGNPNAVRLEAFNVTTTGLVFAGNDANSSIIATINDDLLLGGGGNDGLSGNDGDDTIRGGTGNDLLSELGGGDADDLDGEEGSDFYDLTDFFLNPVDPLFVLNDSGTSGTDTLRFVFRTDASASLPGNIAGIEVLNVSVLHGGTGASAVPHFIDFDASSSPIGLAIEGLTTTGASSGLTLTGTEFDDSFTTESAGVHFIGGAGNDTFSGVADTDFDGGDGFDTVRFGVSGTFAPEWTGIEAVELLGLDLRASLAQNALEITGSDGTNRILATRFGDSVDGGAGNDALAGGPGNDTLTGGAGNDQLLGGAGDDVFIDFAAGDRIQGGAGSDTLLLAGADQTLALTAISNTALRSVETIDITGTGDNTLRLNFDDVKYNLGKDATLRVERDAGDTVDLAGTWVEDTVSGGFTTWHATKNGQTVFVEIEDTAAGGGGLTIFAQPGPDDIVGGEGNDTVIFQDGTFDFSDDSADGGNGTDKLVVDGTLVNMFEGTFVSFENVQLENSAELTANDDALSIAAISGSNRAHLGANAAQSYQGNVEADYVFLGAPGQSVSAGDGDDEVTASNAQLAGATIDLGAEGDQLIIEGTGTADLDTAALLSGGLNISYDNGIDILKLNDAGHTVFVNANADATFFSGDNSAGDDVFRFGSNDWTGRGYTINDFQTGAGGDRIEIFIASFAGDYYGEANNTNFDDVLPDDGLRNAVFNTDSRTLILDYNRNGIYDPAGDLSVLVVTAPTLTEGTDFIF
ncbi:MAG: hypothetical protein A3D95_00525 [Betaproteobacteria bacterium RIFCSPHIGHO2_12_FULL_69_13]|nr:MAG: hypothetical protein A3D95_00525 [Betaproteobacteria bacterium RIFCSPHIGHO2_12_FULL_69_13]